ncbi:Alpha-mannosidase 2C1 [Irineochytrium annulatum]|nr:Alpha-mannosidase 2C1 [Irineochytrium annulatum]
MQAAATSNLNTMQKVRDPGHRNITVERLDKFLERGQFADVNLWSALWSQADSSAVHLSVFAVPDLKRIPFKEAVKGTFKPAKVGESFGPSWATFWFKVSLTIPDSFTGHEVIFNFDPECEGMIWSTEGEVIQGITGGSDGNRHVDYPLTKKAKGGEKEALRCSANYKTWTGMINPPDPNRRYTLKLAEVAVPNKAAFDLLYDYQIILGLVKQLPPESQLNADAIYTGNKIVNTFLPNDQDSVVAAVKISKDFLASRKKAGASDHVITAIGNCHIDTAWLWPFDETKRKSARSWATQIGLMDDYPHTKFAASQAQQFEWVEGLYPDLFEKIKNRAASGQFVPIGGTWVEMDCNIPSGEALCRQFLYGQRYFESRFGARCSVFWLPDTFGYSAQLPQIVKEADLKYFFTQKLSWNNINVFPNTTFMWTGLDGTSVLTHFSPADTYSAQGTVDEVVKCLKNNKDKSYSNKSLYLYGNGDGGGGPLIPMIERINRMKNVEGLPATIKFGSPNDFFRELEETSRDLVSWKGELYFELHRGTYTSHGIIKKYNRKLEFLLRDVELLSTVAALHADAASGFTYPKPELDRLWKLVLLNQFHDVLPGSSIGMVYEDAIKFYEDVEVSGSRLRTDAIRSIGGHYGAKGGDLAQAIAVYNTNSWPRTAEIVEVDLSQLRAGVEFYKRASWHQLSADGKALVLADNNFKVDNVPAMSVKSYGIGNKPAVFSPVTVERVGDRRVVIENAFVRVKMDGNGRILSYYDKEADREVENLSPLLRSFLTRACQIIAEGQAANVFKLYEDIPLFWDAWDVEVYHLEKGRDAVLGDVVVEESGPLRVVIRARHPITKTSSINQRIILSAMDRRLDFHTTVDWNENRTFLKVEFPVAIDCDFATYETQFGFIQRPTHYNNSWDLARFEVCGHKFADFSEFGYGVALLNDSKYGYSVKGNTMRLSLLRSPKAPDQHCDIGTHVFRYALYPHAGTFVESDVVKQGYHFNVPLVVTPILVNPKAVSTGSSVHEFFKVDGRNVVLDTVKIAEDPRAKSGGTDVVIRLYEAYGGRGNVRLSR